jgi:hypothetical protein
MDRELNGGGRQRKGFSVRREPWQSEVDLIEQIQHTEADAGDGRHQYRGNARCDHAVFDRRGSARVFQEAA